MGAFTNRTGEININNFGSEMVIVEYRNARDIDVFFSEYDWTAKSVEYGKFKNGNVKCPYEPKVYNHGYIGEGKYKVSENGKKTKCYTIWQHMLERCYDEKYHKKEPTYKNCTVDNNWLNFQNFAKWYYENFYQIEEEKMCLDKDILNKGNKVYSDKTCVFVPNNINSLFTKSDKVRGKHPVGVCYNKAKKKFQAKCSVYDYDKNKKKLKHLGYYETPEQAFEVYKEFKENYIKQVADYYKKNIPDKLYNAMYEYKINIDD